MTTVNTRRALWICIVVIQTMCVYVCLHTRAYALSIHRETKRTVQTLRRKAEPVAGWSHSLWLVWSSLSYVCVIGKRASPLVLHVTYYTNAQRPK